MGYLVNLKLNNLTEAVHINENLEMKHREHFWKIDDGKILRDAKRNCVPYAIATATKQDFSSPDASWFKGENIEFVKRVINDKQSPLYEYTDYEIILKLVDEHLEGKKNRRLLIWSLLNVEAWMKDCP